MTLADIQWNASYPSVHALVEAISNDPECNVDIMGIRNPPFQTQLTEIVDTLKILRKDRPHGPKAIMSAHDTTAVTSELLLLNTS